MPENPYKSPAIVTPSEAPDGAHSRGTALAIAVAAAVVGLMAGWQTLIIYAFSTMIHPDIVGRERWRMIASRFLFGDGLLQVVFIFAFLFLTATGLIAFVAFLVSAVTRRLTLKNAAIVSCCGGMTLTLMIIGWLLALCTR